MRVVNLKALILTGAMYAVVFLAGITISDTYLSGWIAAAIAVFIAHNWPALSG
jgi:hypothetical protein